MRVSWSDSKSGRSEGREARHAQNQFTNLANYLAQAGDVDRLTRQETLRGASESLPAALWQHRRPPPGWTPGWTPAECSPGLARGIR